MDKHDKSTQARVVRVARVAAGLTLLPIGIALLVLPGPGIPIVAGSLMLLEDEMPWAGRARVKLGDAARAGASWVQKRRRRSE